MQTTLYVQQLMSTCYTFENVILARCISQLLRFTMAEPVVLKLCWHHLSLGMFSDYTLMISNSMSRPRPRLLSHRDQDLFRESRPRLFVMIMVIDMIVDGCRVPKPEAVGYRYTEVVRKQDLRRKMDGFACFQCQQVSLRTGMGRLPFSFQYLIGSAYMLDSTGTVYVSLLLIWHRNNFWHYRALYRKDLQYWRKERRISLAVAWQFSSLEPDLSMFGPGASAFVGAWTNMFMNFLWYLFATVNLRWHS